MPVALNPLDWIGSLPLLTFGAARVAPTIFGLATAARRATARGAGAALVNLVAPPGAPHRRRRISGSQLLRRTVRANSDHCFFRRRVATSRPTTPIAISPNVPGSGTAGTRPSLPRAVLPYIPS